MTPITGKTVYVLGAGASHHTGAPLLRDFLVGARVLKEQAGSLKYKDSFDLIFNWIDRLRGSSYYVELDLDNLEHIFSLAEMQKQLGLENGDALFTALIHVIEETLDHRCEVEWKGGAFLPDGVYRDFLKNFIQFNEERRQVLQQSPSEFKHDSIVTFNYDVMLDYAIYYANLRPEYCIYNTPIGSPIKLLKLHGSTNWIKCRHCQNFQVSAEDPRPIPKGHSVSPHTKDGQKFPFRMVTEVLAKLPCPSCRKEDSLDPLLIPPTWSKTIQSAQLKKVWATAVQEIQEAFQIVIIGYSMPSTDTFFHYLMAVGLSGNPHLNRVVVVNRDNSPNLKGRYRRVFSRSMKDRGRLIFFDDTGGLRPRSIDSFSAFVKEGMRMVATQIQIPE